MTVRAGINGFGRMGRLGLRAGWGNEGLAVVRVNEIATDAAGSAHLLKFDSVHGTWSVDCDAEGETMIVGGQRIACSRKPTIDETDWSDCDIVIEATGKHHKQPETLQRYFDQGVKKVIVAAPTEGALNIVYGINDHLYDPAEHHLVTAASCTTNCLAPVVKVMHEQHRHRARLHDHHPRYHQHPDHRRQGSQGPAPGQRLWPVAYPDEHGFRQGNHQNLPGTRPASSTATPFAYPCSMPR